MKGSQHLTASVPKPLSIDQSNQPNSVIKFGVDTFFDLGGQSAQTELGDHDPLDLIERDDVGRAVIELGRAGALVRGHSLGVLECTAGLEVGGDAGGAESVAADLRLEARVGRAPADHPPDIDTVHR